MVTLILFSTSTCAYCRPIKTIIDNLKPDYEDEDRVLFTNIEVDTDPSGMAIAREWLIRAVPTILVISKGEEVERMEGDINREKIVDAIERNI